MKTITVDGVEYVERPSKGPRAVVVIDKGWIYAGDLTEENGRIYLDRAVWVFSWREVGFDGVIDNPMQDNVTLKQMKRRIDIPAASEVYRVPVEDNWGLA